MMKPLKSMKLPAHCCWVSESRDKIRGLCSASKKADGAKHKPWGVKRRDHFGSERKDADIRKELEKNALVAARKYLSSVGAVEHASGARELIARTDGLGVSASLAAPIDAEAVFGTPAVLLATASY